MGLDLNDPKIVDRIKAIVNNEKAIVKINTATDLFCELKGKDKIGTPLYQILNWI